MDRDELVEHLWQEFQIERVGAVGFCLGWVIVHFHENAIYSGSHSRAREQWDVFRLATADCRTIARTG